MAQPTTFNYDPSQLQENAETIARLQQEFARIDLNGDGKVDKFEMTRFLA